MGGNRILMGVKDNQRRFVIGRCTFDPCQEIVSTGFHLLANRRNSTPFEEPLQKRRKPEFTVRLRIRLRPTSG